MPKNTTHHNDLAKPGTQMSQPSVQHTDGKATIAAWLAQLVEHQSAVREVEGSSPRPDQHSGS